MATAPRTDDPEFNPRISWLIMLSVGVGLWLTDVVLGWRDERIAPWAWRLFSLFVPTILGLMLRPMPGGALVLLAMVATILCDALPPAPATLSTSAQQNWPYLQALGGYADPTVWLVLAAYFLARALINTGLARRIALLLIRALGHRTLGLSYAVLTADVVLAGIIPSNGARVGGVILPITRSLAELYRSLPGPTAGLLGTFLMLTLYQGDIVACALFLTGQASNPLAASQAATLTDGAVQLSYGRWFLYASVPALVSLMLVPWLVFRLCRPTITRTPEVVDLARRELQSLGRPGRNEGLMLLVFLGVCLAWMFTDSVWTTLIALSGAGILFLAGVLTWEDALAERGAWDVFIWYGGLVQLGKLLHEGKVLLVFADLLGRELSWLHPAMLFVVILLIYFYAHYGFASITTHILAMYPAFVGVLLARGASPWLVTCAFAYFANLSAGLTHYGTTPGPIIFGTGYVSRQTWWRVGLTLSAVNVVIWLVVGLAWWKLCGLW